MKANIGDWLIVQGHHVGEPNRKARILEVHGTNGEPPYVVEWDDGHISTYFPSSDATVEAHPATHLPG